MELNSHKETIESVSVSHPVLGFILFWGGFILGIFSLSTEGVLNDINLFLAIFLKLLSIVSILLSVVIYWDKIAANGKVMLSDIKSKFQRKK